MTVAGITAEYNPFHGGHGYQLKKTMDALGENGAVVVVMSGDFVQRGSGAVFSKFARAEAAVQCGASLVIELPLPWCMASAEKFAQGAVSLMKATGVVDTISFGCESGDARGLQNAAQALVNPALDEVIRRELSIGISYAAARERAVAEIAGEEVAAYLRSPNDLLAVEYLKASIQLGADFRPFAVKRESSVHDGVGSASEIRAAMEQGIAFDAAIPAEAMAVYHREIQQGRGPVLSSALRPLLMSRLRFLTKEEFAAVPDAGEGLENLLYEAAREETSPEAVAMAAKSKRYALSRLRRMTHAAALGLTSELAEGLPPYIRVLAMDEKGCALLRRMKKTATLPVVIKPAAVRELDERSYRVFRLGSRAHDLYALANPSETERRGGADWRTSPYIK